MGNLPLSFNVRNQSISTMLDFKQGRFSVFT